MVLLKHLSNFWRTLEMPLISCEISLQLKWSKHCILVPGTAANQNPTFQKKTYKTLRHCCNFINSRKHKTSETISYELIKSFVFYQKQNVRVFVIILVMTMKAVAFESLPEIDGFVEKLFFVINLLQ